MSDCPECGEQVFPDHPEWGVILCNRPDGHEPPHARFETVKPADPELDAQMRADG